MLSFLNFDPNNVVGTYGYWAVAVIVGLESMGIPLPGETVLVAAAIFAGATKALSLDLVIAAAACGAIVGDSLGFWLGRGIGFPLLHKYGRYIGVTEARLKLGLLLFMRHGGKVVFFGRFVALLRALAAFLAGTNRMYWPRFLVFNVAGGIVWATIFGGGAYAFGASINLIAGPLGIALLVLGIIAAAIGFVFVRHHERQLLERAERAFPGPLEHWHGLHHSAHRAELEERTRNQILTAFQLQLRRPRARMGAGPLRQH